MLKPHDFAPKAEHAFNSRNMEMLLSLFSETFVYRDPNGESRGKEATRAREEALFSAFPDIQVEMTPVAWTDTALAMTAVMTGTFENAFSVGESVLPPNGQRFSFGFAAHIQIRDGLAVSEDVFYDRLNLLQALGQS